MGSLFYGFDEKMISNLNEGSAERLYIVGNLINPGSAKCMTIEKSDQQLMVSVKDHDISAYEMLVERYEQPLFGFFWRLGVDKETARDFVQETFLRLWRARDRYAPKGQFSGYLFRIAKNYYLNERSKEQFRTQIEKEYIDFRQRSAKQRSQDAFHSAVNEELHETFRLAVSRLPDELRLVWVLSEYRQMSYQEIGHVLDCSAATVCSRKAEAVEQLQRMLVSLESAFFECQHPADDNQCMST